MDDYDLRYKICYARLISAHQEALNSPHVKEKEKQRIRDMVIGRTQTWLNTDNVTTNNQKPKDVPFDLFKKIVFTLPFPNKASVEEYDLYPRWVEKD